MLLIADQAIVCQGLNDVHNYVAMRAASDAVQHEAAATVFSSLCSIVDVVYMYGTVPRRTDFGF